MQQDIFTNLFLQSDIFTIHRLCQLSKEILKYCQSSYLWSLKCSYDDLTLKEKEVSLLTWFKKYHDHRALKYHDEQFKNYPNFHFDASKKKSYCIIQTALIELEKSLNDDIQIYIKIPIAIKQLLFNLLPKKIKPKYFNVITLHIKKDNYKMSFRQLNLKTIGFDESVYVKHKEDVVYHLNNESILYYLFIILYQGYYTDIVDYKNQTFRYEIMNEKSCRYGIMTSINYLINHQIINYI